MTQFQQIGPNRYWVKSHTEDPYLIYALVDPRTNRIKYIGKTVRGMRRIFEHFMPSSYNCDNTRKNNWIKSLLKQGLKPNYCILVSINTNDSKEEMNIKLSKAERDIITFYKLCYPNELLNHSDGGEGLVGYQISLETRKKMSLSAKARGLNNSKVRLEDKIINDIECRLTNCCSSWIPIKSLIQSNNIYSRQCKKCFNKNRKSRAKNANN